MQLNELVESESIQAISHKTNITEEHIEQLLEERFESIERPKALGFISIIEREYDLDLSKLREKALEYYNAHQQEYGVVFSDITTAEKEQKSKGVLWVAPLLLVGISWYFYTLYERDHTLVHLPFGEQNKTQVERASNAVISQSTTKEAPHPESTPPHVTTTQAPTAERSSTTEAPTPTEKSTTAEKSRKVEELASTQSTTTKEPAKEMSATTPVSKPEAPVAKEPMPEPSQSATVPTTDSVAQEDHNSSEHNTTSDKKSSSESTEATEAQRATPTTAIEKIVIIPRKRVWVGIINPKRHTRKNRTLTKAFEVDVRQGPWLLVTSAAPFSAKVGEKRTLFSNGKSHYLKLDSRGIQELTKAQYRALGGYPKW